MPITLPYIVVVTHAYPNTFMQWVNARHINLCETTQATRKTASIVRHVVDKVGIGRNCLSLKQLSDFYITSSRTQHIRLWSFNICLVLLIVQAHREFDVAPIVSTPQRPPSSLRLMPSDVVLGLDVRHAQPNTLRSTRRRRIFQSTFWRSGENSGRLFSSACVIFTRFG